jgi:hypothetical protein
MIVRQKSAWIETAQATAALATASRAATTPDGTSHHISSISGGYSGSSQAGVIELKQGATVIGRWRFFGYFHVDFPAPIRIAPGSAASVELSAGAGGIIGSVTFTGLTE